MKIYLGKQDTTENLLYADKSVALSEDELFVAKAEFSKTQIFPVENIAQVFIHPLCSNDLQTFSLETLLRPSHPTRFSSTVALCIRGQKEWIFSDVEDTIQFLDVLRSLIAEEILITVGHPITNSKI